MTTPGDYLPPLVSTAVTYCITHGATDHDDKKWEACRFRQLFYFENPMDEHTVLWSDETVGADPAIPELGPGYRSPWEPLQRGAVGRGGTDSANSSAADR